MLVTVMGGSIVTVTSITAIATSAITIAAIFSVITIAIIVAVLPLGHIYAIEYNAGIRKFFILTQ